MPIPKIIHYVWFGSAKISPLGERCIASWKRYFPDYELKKWDESNFDIRCCDYISEAYDAKKWAFVSDYARFKILYEEGGLYFDTDVEVISSLENIIQHGAFMGMETDAKRGDGGNGCSGLTVNPGLGIASEPGNPIYREVLNSYECDHFLRRDGSYDLTTIVVRTTEILRAHGLKPEPGVQRVAGINIYPKEYLCPLDYETGRLAITDNTVAIHWYDASWFSDDLKYLLKTKHEIMRQHPGIPYVIASSWSWLRLCTKRRSLSPIVNRLLERCK